MAYSSTFSSESQPLHPFSYLTFTLDASRQRSTPSCIYIYASLRKLLIVSVQSKSKRDATGFGGCRSYLVSIIVISNQWRLLVVCHPERSEGSFCVAGQIN